MLALQKQWDDLYMSRGIDGVVDLLTSGPQMHKLNGMAWIMKRQHVNMIPLVLSLSTDPDNIVRGSSLAVLVSFPRLTLQPHLPTMQGIHGAEPDPSLAEVWQVLITEVQNA